MLHVFASIVSKFALLPTTPYVGVYDMRFVALSVAVAVLSAFTAFSVADRIAAVKRIEQKLKWTAVGALTLGTGVWAMHFIGMLAFSLPCGVGYDPLLTIASVVPGVLASGTALFAVSRDKPLPQHYLLLCAVVMGAGIGMMHYSGMAAMRLDALLHYDPTVFMLSILVAVVLSYFSLYVRIQLATVHTHRWIKAFFPALVMGGAIAGMHYTAMEASVFYPVTGVLVFGMIYSPEVVAVIIACVAAFFAIATFTITSAVKRRELTQSLRAEIARREASEKEARTERARLGAIFDAAADAIVTVDQDGRILQWSNGAQRIFGYALSEIVGQNLSLLLPESVRADRDTAIEVFLQAGKANDVAVGRELPALRKDGSEFPMEFSVSEVRTGNELFSAVIMRDITDRKRFQQDLIRAREEAEAANVAKSQFLATMSHEIRTPLNGVIGMANLLSSTQLDVRQDRLVANLSRSGQALLAIINDILDFSKIEAGRLELFEVDFDPREVIADVADLFCERCTAKGLELVYFVGEDVPEKLKGDPGRVRQILVNLVGNAMKFTERGEILIELGIVKSEAESLVLSFAVEDTGIGIAPEKRSQVFQSFRQVDDSMTRSRGGTGLGLAISRQLVEMMGGAIGLESELGRGSRFHFTIRCNRSAQDKRTERKLDRPLRVLATDGNAVSAHVQSMYFALWGIDATFANTAAEAEAYWDAAVTGGQNFDAVIVDLKGLAEAGIALGRKIRDDRRGQTSDVIFLIGMDRFVADKSLDAIDAIATLSKPVRPSELFNALAAVASGARKSGISEFYVRRTGHGAMPFFNARILVAEDNPVNQDVATGVLENMGCKVVTAPNGAVAARLLAQEKFDLVLMDCEMPEMDGFEATRRIRKLEGMTSALENDGERRRTPIVALTAHALADIRDRCLAAGMDDFLVKPFDEWQMGEALRRWIGKCEREPTEIERKRATRRFVAPVAVVEESPIDRASLDNVTAFRGPNGSVLLQRVVTRFSDTAPSLVASLKEKHQADAAEDMWRIAHTLKSSSAALGAIRLSKICAEIEAQGKTNGVGPVGPLLEPLETELAAALKSLAAIVGERHESVAAVG